MTATTATASCSERASETFRSTAASLVGERTTRTHAYSAATAPFTGTSVNLAVFDGDSNTNTKDAGWYGDNSGSLSYTITYVG